MTHALKYASSYNNSCLISKLTWVLRGNLFENSQQSWKRNFEYRFAFHFHWDVQNIKMRCIFWMVTNFNDRSNHSCWGNVLKRRIGTASQVEFYHRWWKAKNNARLDAESLSNAKQIELTFPIVTHFALCINRRCCRRRLRQSVCFDTFAWYFTCLVFLFSIPTIIQISTDHRSTVTDWFNSIS